MRPHAMLVGSTILGLSGCLGQTEGRVEEVVDAAPDSRPQPLDGDATHDEATGGDTTVASDASQPTDTRPDAGDAVPPDGEICTGALTVGAVQTVDFERWDDGSPVALDRGALYGVRRVVASNAEWQDLEVVAVDLDTLAERVLTSNDVDDAVLDAHGGAVLAWRRDGQTQTLARIGTAGGGAWSYTLPDGFALLPGYFDDGAPRRLIDGPRAVWAEQFHGDGVGSKARVRVREQDDVRTLAEVSGYVRAPFVRGRSVIWAEQHGLPYVLKRAIGDQVVEIAEGAIGPYGQIDGAAVWLEDGKLIMRRDDARLVLHEGPCGALAVGAGEIATVCGPRVEPAAGFAGIASGDIVVVRPDEGRWTVSIDDDVVVAGLRVDGARVAWVEYPPGVGCGGGAELDRGTVVVADYRAGSRVAVSEIGAGCWCCGAYWPPVATALDGERVAWSYALGGDGDPWGRASTIGVARVTTACPP